MVTLQKNEKKWKRCEMLSTFYILLSAKTYLSIKKVLADSNHFYLLVRNDAQPAQYVVKVGYNH